MELDLRLISNALGLPFPTSKQAGPVLISEALPPPQLWTTLLEALSSHAPVAIADPGWPEAWNDRLLPLSSSGTGPRDILLPTSGSTSIPKWCRHTIASLSSAAHGFATLYAKELPHAVVVLPQHHVGGLMPVLRAAACEGSVYFADYRLPENIQNAPFPLQQASMSLVPTQLKRLLQHPHGVPLLRRFGAIFVGGAACPGELLETARRENIRLAPCYGATETAAMVTVLDPAAFLSGHNGVGQPLPHASILLNEESRILIESPALFKGYLGEPPRDECTAFATSDIGRWDQTGSLHVLKRSDRVLLSGGELVHPEAVEAAARECCPEAIPTCIGVEDPLWGQRVELVLSCPPHLPIQTAQLLLDLKKRLPPAAVPKHIHLRSEHLK